MRILILLFFISAPAFAQTPHTLIRRISVFPIKTAPEFSEAADGAWWELRENLSAYDATYVALAEALESPLVTADGRLARAPGPQCTITVVRR